MTQYIICLVFKSAVRHKTKNKKLIRSLTKKQCNGEAERKKVSTEKKVQKIDWKQLGQFVAILVRLYSVVSEHFKRLKIGLEILEWLDNEGKDYFHGMIIDLASEYSKSKAIVGDSVSHFISSTHKLTVNYDRSIADSVKSGNYDLVDNNITNQNSSSIETGAKGLDMALFHFKRGFSSNSAISEMAKVGYRPATMKELLAFGEKNPELQRKFPIVELGSVTWLGDRPHVGCLFSDVSKRSLNLFYLGYGWYDIFHFLAVRN